MNSKQTFNIRERVTVNLKTGCKILKFQTNLLVGGMFIFNSACIYSVLLLPWLVLQKNQCILYCSLRNMFAMAFNSPDLYAVNQFTCNFTEVLLLQKELFRKR